MELIEPAPGAKNISFDRHEWKHLIDELEMRNGREMSKCVNNARYLAKLDISFQQARNGQVVVKTLEELEAME